MDRPIIIGSAASSGSTLLRILLQRHPNIAGRGEIAILDKPGLYEESPASFQKNIGRWLDRGYPDLYVAGAPALFTQLHEYPWTREELRAFCTSCSSFPEMIKGFFAHNSRVWGRPRWLEKTPPNIYCFRQIRKIFPGAQFIQIVRDARDSMLSYYRRIRNPFLTAIKWYFPTLAGLQYADWDNFLVVKYEDLVRNPEETLREICRFLGEEYTDRLLEAESPSIDKIPTWQNHPQAPITNRSIGRHADGLPDEIKSVFKQLRPTEAGQQLLPYGASNSGPLTPAEVQEHLGYSLDNLDTSRPVSYRLRMECRKNFWRWRFRRWRHFHTWAKCPVRIVSSH